MPERTKTADMVAVVRILEVGGSRRQIADRLDFPLAKVQALIDQAALRWLERWRQDRSHDELDNLAEPH